MYLSGEIIYIIYLIYLELNLLDILPRINLEMNTPLDPISGVRCPTCPAKGQEVWVIPGKACGYCGTACG